jgi:predicted transcriptional regulator
MNPPLDRLGAVVADALRSAGVSKERAATELGISRATLNRRIKRSNFRDTETYRLRTLLRFDRASRLYAPAERDQA